MTQDQDLAPITRIPRTGLPPRAVVVGDPARAAAVAALLDESDKPLSTEEREQIASAIQRLRADGN